MKKKLFFLLVVILSIGVLILAAIKIVNYVSDNAKNRKIAEATGEFVTTDDETSDGPDYTIDFAALKAENPDTVGYLKVENTNIDYVVVQGVDNDYYLSHNFNRENNVSGWVFVDYRNRLDGSDRNIIIYGHDVRDGSMLGSLKSALESDWQTNLENLQIVWVTEQGTYLYKVFSTYVIAPEDYYISTDFTTAAEFNDFVKTLRTRSNHDYGAEVGAEVGAESQILTLSTCADNGARRVVLHAKLLWYD